MSLKSKAVEATAHVQDVHPVETLKRARSIKRIFPNKLVRSASRATLHVQHKSPELLFGAGLVLGTATVVSACRATLKLEGRLDEMKSDLDDVRELHNLGKVDDGELRHMTAYIKAKGATSIGKLYAPSLGLGVLAVASLTGSHHIMTRRNVAMTAAYAAVEKSFDEYRERVVAKYGEDEDRNIMFAGQERTVVEEDENGKVTKKVEKTFGHGRSPYARMWDQTTSSEWKNNAYSNRNFLKCNQQWANDQLQMEGHLFLNDVYKMLGLEPTSAGQAVGWVVGNGDSFVDFGLFSRQHTDERVHEFMFGDEKSVMLDFNVDGPVYKLLDELRTTKD